MVVDTENLRLKIGASKIVPQLFSKALAFLLSFGDENNTDLHCQKGSNFTSLVGRFARFIFEEFVAETAVEEQEILIETVGKSCISEMREVGTQYEAFAEKPIETKAGIVVDEIGIEFGAEFVARHIVIGSVTDIEIYIFVDIAAQKYASVGIEVIGFIELVIDE